MGHWFASPIPDLGGDGMIGGQGGGAVRGWGRLVIRVRVRVSGCSARHSNKLL